MTRNAAGRYRANGNALSFYHFTKAEGVGQEMTDLFSGGSTAVSDLWRDYLGALRTKRSTLPSAPRWGYHQPSPEFLAKKAGRHLGSPAVRETGMHPS